MTKMWYIKTKFKQGGVTKLSNQDVGCGHHYCLNLHVAYATSRFKYK